MEPAGATLPGPELESLQFGEEIHRLITAPPDNGSSFTALLELPPTQAMELLHLSPEPDAAPTPPAAISGETLPQPYVHPPPAAFNSGLAFPDLKERAAKFSVFSGDPSPETSSVPSNSGADLEKVKSEPAETDSNNPNSSQLTLDEAKNSHQRPSAKRKEREKKVKALAKKIKSEIKEAEAEKIPYVHVRARRGQATDSHSLAERARREKINARMKLLQELVPGCNKISGTALVLDEIINHVQSLQHQVEFLSMRLAAVNPRIDFDLDNILAAESASLMESNLTNMVTPLMWPELPINGNRQQFQQQWHFDALHQPGWGREEENHTFITPEGPLISCDSSANSATLQTSNLKMEM